MPVEILVISGVGLILVALGLLFLMTSEKKGKKKRVRPKVEPTQIQKELEEKVFRLGEHISKLRGEVLAMQKTNKATEKELMVERVKVKKFQEKLSQEHQWYEKEQNTIDKKEKEFHELKAEFVKIQDAFAKEHAVNIRLERDLAETNRKIHTLNDQRRRMEGENAQFKAKIDNDRKEIAQLKKEIAQLTKKEKDIQWIAKPEYDRVAELLREKEKKLQRLERELEK